MLRIIICCCALVSVLSVAAPASSAGAAAEATTTELEIGAAPSSPFHRQSRSLQQEIDYYSKFCQSQGATVNSCYKTLDDPHACRNCHSSFIGHETNLLTTTCQSKCTGWLHEEPYTTLTEAVDCNYNGYHAINCINGKIWEYHCRDEVNNLNLCGGELHGGEIILLQTNSTSTTKSTNTANTTTTSTCTGETHALEHCLNTGIKVLRGRSIPQCNGQTERLNVCLDKQFTFSPEDKNQCKKCYSDVGFGINTNTTCSCYCDIEGVDLAWCIRNYYSTKHCPRLIRREIDCSESQFVCYEFTCYEHWVDDSSDDMYFDPTRYNNLTTTRLDTNATATSSSSNMCAVFDRPYDIDWDIMRDKIEEGKEVAARIREEYTRSSGYSFYRCSKRRSLAGGFLLLFFGWGILCSL